MNQRIIYPTDDGVAIIVPAPECRLTCTADYPEFQAWLEEGNQPLPAEE